MNLSSSGSRRTWISELTLIFIWVLIALFNSGVILLVYVQVFRGTPITKEEMGRIRNLQLSEAQAYLDPIRDVFLFCCFSGLRHSDANNLPQIIRRGLPGSDVQDNYSVEHLWIPCRIGNDCPTVIVHFGTSSKPFPEMWDVFSCLVPKSEYHFRVPFWYSPEKKRGFSQKSQFFVLFFKYSCLTCAWAKGYGKEALLRYKICKNRVQEFALANGVPMMN